MVWMCSGGLWACPTIKCAPAGQMKSLFLPLTPFKLTTVHGVFSSSPSSSSSQLLETPEDAALWLFDGKGELCLAGIFCQECQGDIFRKYLIYPALNSSFLAWHRDPLIPAMWFLAGKGIIQERKNLWKSLPWLYPKPTCPRWTSELFAGCSAWTTELKACWG